jgi:hypothetical protein
LKTNAEEELTAARGAAEAGAGVGLVFPCRWLAQLFGQPAWSLGAMSAGAGALAALLAWPTRLGTSALDGGFAQCNAAGVYLDVGYWFQLHWAIGYTVVIPVALGVGAAAARRFVDCVRIMAATGVHDARFAALPPWSRWWCVSWLVRWGVPVVMSCIQVRAGWWPNVFQLFVSAWRDGTTMTCPSGPPFMPEVDWTIAALTWQRGLVSWLANVLFDAYAALLDLGSGFLLTLWATHMLVALCRLWSGLLSRRGGFAFDPLVFDPMRRFGLHALGRVYDSVFLGLTLLGLQSCLKHLSRMRRVVGIDELQYLTSDQHFSTAQFAVTMRALDLADLVLLSIACLSLVALLLVPRFTVVRLVNEYRDRLFCERIRGFETASRTTPDADKVLMSQFRALDDVHPWPDGDVAYLWIAAFFALTAWAICPIGAPLVVSLAVAAKPAMTFVLGRAKVSGKNEG